MLLKLFRVHLSRPQSLLHQRHKSMPSFTKMLLRVCSAPQKCTQGWCKKSARNHQIYVLPEVFREDSPMTDLPSLIDHEKSEAKLATISETNRRLGFKYFNLNEEWKHHRNYWEHDANFEGSKGTCCFLKGEQ